jgi:hypothetical protein
VDSVDNSSGPVCLLPHPGPSLTGISLFSATVCLDFFLLPAMTFMIIADGCSVVDKTVDEQKSIFVLGIIG